MRPLGPWASAERIAVAVSGGADSLCLALLAARWGMPRGIRVLGLIVDHGLRAEAAGEARLTAARLDAHGIASRLLTLDGLPPGPSLAERARAARYAALRACCRASGIVDLLVGHHAGDQAETVLMRRRAGSGADGLAGMASLSETDALRLVRPLLTQPPERLRATLRGFAVGWVEDPSNRDDRALRSRLRRELAGPDAAGLAAELLAAAAEAGAARTARDLEQAGDLALTTMLMPEGFALLPPRLVPPRALAALMRTIGGASYPPATRGVAALVQDPRPATLAGTRLMRAGRLGAGWLLLREAARVGAPVPAVPEAVWDRRFRLRGPATDLPPGLSIGALGRDAARDRTRPDLPAAVLAVMPTLRTADGRPVRQIGIFDFEPVVPATTRPAFFR